MAPAPWLQPNPAGTDGDDLTRLGIGSVNYNLAAGGGSVIDPDTTAWKRQASEDVLQWDPWTLRPWPAHSCTSYGTPQILTWERLPVDEVLAAHGVYAAVTYRGVLASQSPATVTNGDAYFVRLGSEWDSGDRWALGGILYHLDDLGPSSAYQSRRRGSKSQRVGQIADIPARACKSDHRVYPNRVTALIGRHRSTDRRLQRALFATPTAAEIPLVTTAFVDGNLDATVVNVQDLAQVVNDLVVGSDDADDTPASNPTSSLPRSRRWLSLASRLQASTGWR